ncbi:MAG: hypothetical protein HDR31_01665 [Mycoplasma sp.]|nr:hypothetical protein [Mycoplasma sp.]
MKKIYISCYENNDLKYKNLLIDANKRRNNLIFELNNSTESDFYNLIGDSKSIIEKVKSNLFRDAEVAIFLVGDETKKRKISNWEARAAMSDYGIFRKCGIIIVYLPDLIQKYGSKIPRSVLPSILELNISKPDVYMHETTWEKIIRDINVFDRLLNTAYAYGKMSKYVLNEDIETENQSNYMNLK